MNIMIQNLPDQYARVKGADWFPLLYKRPVLVLGQGGIGSYLSFYLSRIGCELYIFDHDTYDEVNLTGQLVGKDSIGKNKAVAMKKFIEQFSPDCTVETFGMYTEKSMTGEIVMCGFDNMEARKVAFRNWKSFVESRPEEERKECFFQDGRLLSEVIQVINIPGDRPDLIEKYEKDYLFDDKDAAPVSDNCTFKQTSHCAGIIGGMMTGFFTNWAMNVEKGKVIRQVPFYHEYVLPLNMTTNE